jgi:hypothetical protein
VTRFATRLMALLLCAATALAPASQPLAQVRMPALGDDGDEGLPVAAERRYGEQIMREVRRDPAYLDDPVLLEYVQSLWERLVAAADGELKTAVVAKQRNVSPAEARKLLAAADGHLHVAAGRECRQFCGELIGASQRLAIDREHLVLRLDAGLRGRAGLCHVHHHEPARHERVIGRQAKPAAASRRRLLQNGPLRQLEWLADRDFSGLEPWRLFGAEGAGKSSDARGNRARRAKETEKGSCVDHVVHPEPLRSKAGDEYRRFH